MSELNARLLDAIERDIHDTLPLTPEEVEELT